MKIIPKSLAGQALLLVAVALISAQAINLAFLLREVGGRRTIFVEGAAIARMTDGVERALAGLPVGRGDGAPDRANMKVASTPLQMSGMADPQLAARIKSELAIAGYPVQSVKASRDETQDRGRLFVSAHLTDGRWVNLESLLPPGDTGLILRLIGQTIVLLLSLLIAVILIGRHVARPLRRLTAAAESFGTSSKTEPVALQGPSDVQQLIATFNQMQGRILDMLTEKDRMLGAIGHDLRTPLASLRLRVEAISEVSERDRMIATIEEMSRTLHDILSLARLGRSSEEAVKTDLTALIDSLVQDLQDLSQPVKFLSDGRVLATVKPVLIKRGIRNVIENAVKYGGDAEIRLFSGLNEAVVQIDDNGPGIAEDELDRVMEGFVRLEGSRNRGSGGSGLGLTIARSIVHENGGWMRLENLVEGGLRVVISLPLKA